MAAGLPWANVAIADRILRRIAFGFFVITVPPAGCVASKICDALIERSKGYSHLTGALIGGIAYAPAKARRNRASLGPPERWLSKAVTDRSVLSHMPSLADRV
ncbi:MAG: hypothetical protein DLM61_15485 [Pseudonocardiales bacterium]|nr:MAG: hypothetical protein DLM61_15485 [Pseudonocardiales bacterium]